MYRPLCCQGRLRNSESLSFDFISLDRGEIHSYVGSKESHAFDTVQFCLQRKAVARAEYDHGNLTQSSQLQTENKVSPAVPKSSTGS